jgi:hypothetical protein
MAVDVHLERVDSHASRRRYNLVPMTLTILSFLTLFLAIFTPCVAMICKLEESKGLASGANGQPRPQQAESGAAWLPGKRLPTE